MVRSKFVVQRIVSPDGKVIAEAKSVAITSSNSDSPHQAVNVTISSSSYSSSSTSGFTF